MHKLATFFFDAAVESREIFAAQPWSDGLPLGKKRVNDPEYIITRAQNVGVFFEIQNGSLLVRAKESVEGTDTTRSRSR